MMRLKNVTRIFYYRIPLLFLAATFCFGILELSQNKSLAQSPPTIHRSIRNQIPQTVIAAPTPLKIGLAAPLTGPYAHLGADMQSAAYNAMASINDSGGLLGQNIQLYVFDDECQPERARKVAIDFVEKHRVDVVIGHCPQVAETAAKIYAGSDILFISTFTSTEELPIYNNVLHLGVMAKKMGESAGDEIAKKIEEKIFDNVVGIFLDGTSFSKKVASSLKSKFESNGVNLLFIRTARNTNEFWSTLYKNTPKVLFFAFQNPVEVKNLIGPYPLSIPIVMMGLPDSQEQWWKHFYSWAAETHTVSEIFVFAPVVFQRGFLDTATAWQNNILNLWVRKHKFPTIAEIFIFTAFDMIAQVVKETKTKDTQILRNALSNYQKRSTLIGNLRSGEDGEIKPITIRLYWPLYHWTPSYESWRFLQVSEEPAKLAKKEEPPEELGKLGEIEAKQSVYNLDVTPNKSRNPLTLLPGELTELKFYIGTKSPKSVIPAWETPFWHPEDEKDEKLELTLSLYCSFCEKETYYQDHLAYRFKDRSSSKARFEIVPSAAAVKNSNGVGDLIFTIDDGGKILDRFRVKAFVGDPTPEGLAKYVPPVKMPFETIQQAEGEHPEVVINISYPDSSGKLPIIIRPRLKELQKEFKEEFGNGKGSESEMSWKFKSGVTKADLDGLTYGIYMKFRGIMEQNNKQLQKVYRQLGDYVALEAGAAMGDYSDKDREMILYNLKNEGENLYWRIFVANAEVDLKKAMEFIDNLPSEPPLRISIRSVENYAPWQILYPYKKDSAESRKIDSKKFWGFRYLLEFTNEKDGGIGRRQYTTLTPRPDEIAFAGWRGSDSEDEVAERVLLLEEYLESKAGGTIKPSFKRTEFIRKIEKGAKDIKFIFAYGHATSGTVMDPHKPVIGGIELAAAHFKFSENEFLRPRDLDDIAKKFYLESQPVVILDACETGTFGINAMNNNGFVGALTRLGAGAVIVTESPVLANFAYHFGEDLINEIFDQKVDISQAMLNVRLKHLRKWKNPLGLVYTLYGNSTMRIESQ